jgi:phosphohistidine swiveling domain-containing protein
MLPVDEILLTSFKPLPELDSDYFSHRISYHSYEYDLGHFFRLSYIIRSPQDVYIVPQHRSEPNFIGSSSIEAPIVVLSNNDNNEKKLEGSIICIESADPGYDWIFTRNIAGLITRYGGTNSHMAIRCAEYGLPAAIGCGEQLFLQACGGQTIILDCSAKKIVVNNNISSSQDIFTHKTDKVLDDMYLN